MRLIRSILVFLLLLLVLAVGLLFTIQNDVLVPLNVLVADLPAQRLSTWVILAFFVGGLAGLAASSIVIIRLQASRLRLRRLLNSQKTKLARSQATSS